MEARMTYGDHHHFAELRMSGGEVAEQVSLGEMTFWGSPIRGRRIA
jgi:hypothetical protein